MSYVENILENVQCVSIGIRKIVTVREPHAIGGLGKQTDRQAHRQIHR